IEEVCGDGGASYSLSPYSGRRWGRGVLCLRITGAVRRCMRVTPLPNPLPGVPGRGSYVQHRAQRQNHRRLGVAVGADRRALRLGAVEADLRGVTLHHAERAVAFVVAGGWVGEFGVRLEQAMDLGLALWRDE